MTDLSGHYREALRAERQAELLWRTPTALCLAAVLIAAYNLLTALLTPHVPVLHALLLLVEVIIPLGGALLVRHRLVRQHLELALLLLDMVFTTVGLLELSLPTPDPTDIAIALGLKTAGTALIFPWTPVWQAAAAGYTLLAFALSLHASGVAAGPHALVAPVIGALASVVGSMIIDSHRRALHRKQLESAESESKYRSLAEGAVAGVFVYQDDQFRFVNDACARMLGYPPDELVGRSNQALHRAQDLVVVRRMTDELLSGARSATESLLRAYRRDGSEMFGRASYSRIIYEGRPAVLGVFIDVTRERAQQHEAQRLNAEVVASEVRYRDLFENATDLIIESDFEGTFVDANPAALAIAGYEREDLVRGLRLGDLLPPEFLPALAEFRTNLLNGMPVQQPHTVPLRAADGTQHAIELHTRLIHRPGKPPVFQSIGRDVTERQARLTESQQMVTFQRAVTAVAPTLHAPHGLDEVFTLIANVCRDLFQVSLVRLWMIEGDTLVGRGASGHLADQISAWRWSINESALPAMAVRERRPLFVNRLAESPWRAHPIVALGARSWMSIPLMSGATPIGVLALQDHDHADRFTDQSLEWGRIFASQAVLAIENARLRDRERAEARTTTLLLTFAQTLHARLGDVAIHTVLAREAVRILSCDIGSIVLWQADRGRFRVAQVCGLPGEQRTELEGLEFEPQTPNTFGAGIVQFARHQAATTTAALLMERWDVEHVLYLPIRREQALLAMLLLGRRQAQRFSADDLRLAEGVAYHAAIALENQRLLNALQDANRLKSEFVATMSHELRSPLNVVMGYSDLLRDGQFGPVTPEQVETLGRVLQQADQLLQLINTTLDLSRLERGEVTLTHDVFPLGELFAELENEIAPRLQPSGPQLRWHALNGMPVLQTDRGKLKLIIRNLVDNALKFTDRGAIDVSAEHAGGQIEIRVRDTGTGIAADALDAIFEMFRQADSSDRRVRGGVGLGLYIVRRLAAMLGGEVTVDSTLGAGSTFHVTIPLAAAPRTTPDARAIGLTAARLED